MMNSMEALGALIRAHRKDFLINYDVESYYKVNCGLCEEFAHEVYERFEQQHLVEVVYTEHFLDEMDDVDWDRLNLPVPDGLTRKDMEKVHLGGHCFLEMAGRWYDAECPEGADHVLDLPIFRRPVVLALRRKGIPTDDVETDDVVTPPPCKVANPKPVSKSVEHGFSQP